MSGRALRGGMIAFSCAVALMLAGARPAAAADGGIWSRAFGWLVSVWGSTEVGAEIDPNGRPKPQQLQTPPMPPMPATPTDSLGLSAREGSKKALQRPGESRQKSSR